MDEFPRRPELDPGEAPLLFWLIEGYFTSNLDRLRTKGIFRVTSSDACVRELEIHMSQANFSFLESVEDANVVANYFKRVLREMKEPLVPEEQY